MATHVVEFGSKNKYEEWLSEQGNRIKVINLATSRKKWSPWTGAMNIENAQTYTVTYEDVLVGDTKVCPFCGETIKRVAVICRFCNRDLSH